MLSTQIWAGPDFFIKLFCLFCFKNCILTPNTIHLHLNVFETRSRSIFFLKTKQKKQTNNNKTGYSHILASLYYFETPGVVRTSLFGHSTTLLQSSPMSTILTNNINVLKLRLNLRKAAQLSILSLIHTLLCCFFY